MNKRNAIVVIVAGLIGLFAASGVAKDRVIIKDTPRVKFMTADEVSKDIKEYYKDVLATRVNRIYLLEILGDENNEELMQVYYMVDRNPKQYKNAKGHITADRAPIKTATYQYSYLNKAWVIKRVDKEYTGSFVFRDV